MIWVACMTKWSRELVMTFKTILIYIGEYVYFHQLVIN